MAIQDARLGTPCHVAYLKLRVVWGREDSEQAACGSDMIDGEALAHVRQVISAAARIRALMRPQYQPQLVCLKEILHKRPLSGV